MFLSVGVEFEANVEALNMVETAGNYAKHRRVPYLVMREGKLSAVYVPAISGESISHAYQEFLVEEGKNLPICSYCRRGEYFKSMNKEHAKEKFHDGEVPEKVEILEEGIIRNCVVEDIGGFLYAEAPPVKRTSAFQVSYALPVKEYALESVIEPQLQARHAQMKKIETEKDKDGKAQEQMIYYVETGSALYGFTFNLDFEKIGYSSIQGKPLFDAEELKQRRRIASYALLRMLSSQQFGAKLSRFFPVGGITSLVISLTTKPFTVTSPIYKGFADSTKKRLEVLKMVFGEDSVLYKMGEGGLDSPEAVLGEIIKNLQNKEII
ncbi:MAG: type I-A CRISPR-associated protein Cas7/Csa2 [Candidatus Methanosuratincola petrocarbonis]